MAIDFPNSPTPGQVFQGYYWDNTKQAWRSNNPASGSVITSATTPTGATAGDLWFNTVDGTLFVYYDDGITTQWVEVQANVDNYKTPSQNYILNSDMEINQRGITSTPIQRQGTNISHFGPDRWKPYVDFESRYSWVTISDPNVPARYATRLNSTTTSYANPSALAFGQKIESVNSIPLRGKTVTLSFYIRFSNSTFTSSIPANPYNNFRYELGYYTSSTDSLTWGGSSFNTANSFTFGTISNGSLPTTWTRVSLTGVVPANANNIHAGFRFESAGFTSSFDTLWYEITGVQLEEGTIATPFRRNQPNIQAELAACERYYQRYSGGVGCGFAGIANQTTQLIMAFSLPVEMRVPPVVSASGQILISDQYITDREAVSAGISFPQGINNSGGRVTLTGFSSLTVGRYYSTPAASIGSGFIDFNAEL